VKAWPGCSVVVLGMVMPRYFSHWPQPQDAVDSAVIYCGAGVYEESSPADPHSVLEPDLSGRIRDQAHSRGVLMVVISGILFSAYHY